MIRRRGERSLVVLAVVLTSLAALVAPIGGLGVRTVAAQDFGCPPAATPAATAATPADAASSPAPTAVFPEGGGDLTVFAAASLTDAFNQIGQDIEAANPAVSITFNFAGSQTLSTQLTQGAPADVFASANNTQMEVAIDARVVVAEPSTFIRNQLAIVVPVENSANVISPADLARDDLRLVLAEPEVPVGRYSRESICKMGEDMATYGEGFVASVSENIVSQEQDVREVLTKVQLGEADAGIVYVSDVTADAADDVDLIEIPEAVNVIATYPIAPVEGGNAALAAAFIAYLLGPEGQATLEEFGFTPLA